jgi:Domain of unknown function (DUF3576)
MSFVSKTFVALAGALILTGCANGGAERAEIGGQAPKSGGGFPFSLGGGAKPLPAAPAGLGVNAFLWRASLDTLSFMPLASADPFGGVIITDWYANPEKPDERFKATVYILDTRLRADGVSVTVCARGPADGCRRRKRHPDQGAAVKALDDQREGLISRPHGSI